MGIEVGLVVVAGVMFLFTTVFKVSFAGTIAPKSSRAESVRLLLLHGRRSRIADLEDGQASVVHGRVRAIKHVLPLRAPLSGQLVVAINARLLDPYRRPYVDHVACCDFELVDDSGTILVEGRSAEVAILGLIVDTE